MGLSSTMYCSKQVKILWRIPLADKEGFRGQPKVCSWMPCVSRIGLEPLQIRLMPV